MHKFVLHTLTIICSISCLASCKDTPEKFMEDQAEHVEDLSIILEDHINGKTTISEAEADLKKWVNRWKKFDERFDKFANTMSDKEMLDMYTAHIELFRPSLLKIVDQFQTIEADKTLSPRLDQILESSATEEKSFTHIIGLLFRLHEPSDW